MISASLLAAGASLYFLGPVGLLAKVAISGVTYGVTQVSLNEFCNGT